MKEQTIKKIYRIYSKLSLENKKNKEKIVNLFVSKTPNSISSNMLLKIFKFLKSRFYKNIDLEIQFIERKTINTIFITLEGWEIKSNNLKIFFPIDDFKNRLKKDSELKIARCKLLKLGWFFPAYLKANLIISLSKSWDSMDEDLAFMDMENVLLFTYNTDYLSIAFTEIYSKVPYIHYHKHRILESIVTYLSGNIYAAITSLLPVIENIIREMNDLNGQIYSRTVSKNKLIKILDDILKSIIKKNVLSEFDFVPPVYVSHEFFDNIYEQYQIIKGFREFVNNHLYVEFQNISDPGNLNRHLILHGFLEVNDYKYNYLRLISVIDLLSFIIKIGRNEGSLLFPDKTEQSEKYLEYFQSVESIISTINKPSA